MIADLTGENDWKMIADPIESTKKTNLIIYNQIQLTSIKNHMILHTFDEQMPKQMGKQPPLKLKSKFRVTFRHTTIKC